MQQQTGQNWTPHVQISGCSDLSVSEELQFRAPAVSFMFSSRSSYWHTDTHNAGDGLLLYVQRRSHATCIHVLSVRSWKYTVRACMQTAGPRAARPTQCRSLGLAADRKQVRRLLQTCGSVQIHHTALHLTWQTTHFILVHAGLMFSASLMRCCVSFCENTVNTWARVSCEGLYSTFSFTFRKQQQITLRILIMMWINNIFVEASVLLNNTNTPPLLQVCNTSC